MREGFEGSQRFGDCPTSTTSREDGKTTKGKQGQSCPVQKKTGMTVTLWYVFA